MVDKLFLDMDNVLCDFERNVFELWGINRDDPEFKRRPEWDMRPSIAQHLFIDSISIDEFWETIHRWGIAFWIDIDPMPWFGDLVGWATSTVGDNWWVVSSPSPDPISYYGKKAWVNKHLGSDFDRLILTENKTLLARPDACLVDDKETAVESFKERGGKGIVFPGTNNSLLDYTTDPLSYVTQVWSELCT